MSTTAFRDGVVAGYTDTQDARRAAFWAADEAVRRGCPLLLVHAYQPLVSAMAPGGWGPVVPMDETRLRDSVRDRLTELAIECRIRPPGLEVSVDVADGPPAPVLAGAAADTDARLIVLGSSGLGAIPRMVIGSTAANLVRLTRLPVLVVRGTPPNHPAVDAPVVVGVDGTPASTPAIGFAFDFAARHDTPLHAVHAHAESYPTLVGPGSPWEIGPGEREIAGDIDESLLGTWRQAYPDVPVRIEVIDERPAQALLDRSSDAALLVVGSHGHSAVRRVLLGSVSHAALFHSACPVAVLPAPADGREAT